MPCFLKQWKIFITFSITLENKHPFLPDNFSITLLRSPRETVKNYVPAPIPRIFLIIIFLTLASQNSLPPLLSHCAMQCNMQQWTCLHINSFINSALPYLVSTVRARAVRLHHPMLRGPRFAEGQILSASTETHFPPLCQLPWPTKTWRNGTFQK